MSGKYVLVLILLVTLSCSILLYIQVNVQTRNGVYNVDTGLSYEAIQEAIDAPQTKDGNTILIYPGIYRENIVVNKSLTIRGQDRDGTIIERGNRSIIILFIEADNTTVANLTLRNANFGIWCRNVTGSNILSNRVINCISSGIKIESSSNGVIENNEAINGTLRGIELIRSSNNTLTNNEIRNFITPGYGAIHLEYSDSNLITANELMHNACGILLHNSSNNKIYHNSFIDSTNQAHSEFTSLNLWDNGYPSGGNLWSDYTGVDEDGDGIGDTPYIIDEENKDRYPLKP